MKIEHIAIWASDLEVLKDFYCRYFGGTPGEKYHNPKKNFTSYFISFDSGCRLEIMNAPAIGKAEPGGVVYAGLAHFSISTGSREAVDEMTERLRRDGYTITGEPRVTGDGYYESVVTDPEGNLVEITI